MSLIACIAVFFTFAVQTTQSVCPSSSGCFPSPSNLAIGRTLEANSTCGDPVREFTIPLAAGDITLTCDASVPSDAHPASLANDGNSSTWWQAERYEFFVTLQLNLAFPMLVERSTLTFRSFRPRRMILEKSDDDGVTWVPYQYYSTLTCDGANIPDGEFQNLMEGNRGNLPADSTEAFCITADSVLTDPQEFGTVEFRAAERFGNKRFDDVAIIDHLMVTNLRARFRLLQTQGDDGPGADASILQKYYYSVTEWDVQGYCHCNGHAETCVQRGGESTPEGKVLSGCDCQHNTDGVSCERCLPLYNNKPYGKGNSTDQNACERCECNGHSLSCTYDSAKGHGVCDNCMDNTEGDMCERCIANFFRDPTKAFDDPDSCIESGRCCQHYKTEVSSFIILIVLAEFVVSI